MCAYHFCRAQNDRLYNQFKQQSKNKIVELTRENVEDDGTALVAYVRPDAMGEFRIFAGFGQQKIVQPGQNIIDVFNLFFYLKVPSFSGAVIFFQDKQDPTLYTV